MAENPIIYKYTLGVGRNQILQLPKDFQFLSAGAQRGDVVFWALVNPEAEKKDVTFHVVGTGWDLTSALTDVDVASCEYKGTVQSSNLVWHIFMEK